MSLLFEIPDFLEPERVIDEGAFGIVVKVHSKAEPEKCYAIKRVRSYANFRVVDYTRKICREVAILKILNEETRRGIDSIQQDEEAGITSEYLTSLRESNNAIVPFHFAYLSSDKQDVFLLFDYFPFTLERIRKTYLPTLSKSELDDSVRSLARQLLHGLAFSHEQGFLHRDVALKNVLISRDSRLFICDFGLGRLRATEEEECTVEVVTLEYRPPELALKSKKYDARCDVWSAACVVVELYLQHPCFFLGRNEPKDILHLLQKQIFFLGGEFDVDNISCLKKRPAVSRFVKGVVDKLKKDGDLGEKNPSFSILERKLKEAGACDDAVDLLKWMLTFDYTKRPTAAQCLQHRFLSEEDEEEEQQQEQEQEAIAVAAVEKKAEATTTATAEQQQQQQPQQEKEEEKEAKTEKKDDKSDDENEEDEKQGSSNLDSLPQVVIEGHQLLRWMQNATIVDLEGWMQEACNNKIKLHTVQVPEAAAAPNNNNNNNNNDLVVSEQEQNQQQQQQQQRGGESSNESSRISSTTFSATTAASQDTFSAATASASGSSSVVLN